MIRRPRAEEILKLTMPTEPKGKPKPQKSSQLTPCGEETIMDLIIKFACEETGAAALEYSIVLSLIGVFLITSVGALGTAIIHVFGLLTF